MRYGAVFLDSAIFLLWAFICFIYQGIYRFNILLSSLGVVFGLVFGVAVALKQISSLEKIGELRTTLKTWAFMLLTIIILVPIALYLVFSLGPEVGIQMISFLYPSIPALYATVIILYLNWERKQKGSYCLMDLYGPRFTPFQELRGDTQLNHQKRHTVFTVEQKIQLTLYFAKSVERKSSPPSTFGFGFGG